VRYQNLSFAPSRQLAEAVSEIKQQKEIIYFCHAVTLTTCVKQTCSKYIISSSSREVYQLVAQVGGYFLVLSSHRKDVVRTTSVSNFNSFTHSFVFV
jgi:hypothetical protein